MKNKKAVRKQGFGGIIYGSAVVYCSFVCVREGPTHFNVRS